MSDKLTNVIDVLLENPVAFQRVFAQLAGSVTAGLMLSQAWYWTKIVKRTKPKDDGWFYKTQVEWADEICLTRYEQEGARKALRVLDFWREERRGQPAQMYFRLDLEKLYSAISEYAENPQSRMLRSGTLERAKAAYKSAEKPPTIKETETTSKITAESAAPDRGSQDTRSVPVPSVENAERQFTDEFKKLAKGKSLPRNGWSTEPVRADLFGGLHSGKQSSGMHAIAKFFFDSRSLSFRDRLRGCVRVATGVLMSTRIAKLIDLRPEDMDRLALEKLDATPEGLRAMDAMTDPAKQSVMVTQFIARLVVDATAEIYEAQNGYGYQEEMQTAAISA